MTQTQQERLKNALAGFLTAESNAENEDANMAKAEGVLEEKQAPFNNDARIAREGERITKEADKVMAEQNMQITLAKVARDRQFQITSKAHQDLDAAANEYKNAGIGALQTGAIEKV